VKEREVLSLLEKNNLEKKIKFGLDVKKKRERQKKKKMEKWLLYILI
jgi:FixJ family two-component response regulator